MGGCCTAEKNTQEVDIAGGYDLKKGEKGGLDRFKNHIHIIVRL